MFIKTLLRFDWKFRVSRSFYVIRRCRHSHHNIIVLRNLNEKDHELFSKANETMKLDVLEKYDLEKSHLVLKCSDLKSASHYLKTLFKPYNHSGVSFEILPSHIAYYFTTNYNIECDNPNFEHCIKYLPVLFAKKIAQSQNTYYVRFKQIFNSSELFDCFSEHGISENEVIFHHLFKNNFLHNYSFITDRIVRNFSYKQPLSVHTDFQVVDNNHDISDNSTNKNEFISVERTEDFIGKLNDYDVNEPSNFYIPYFHFKNTTDIISTDEIVIGGINNYNELSKSIDLESIQAILNEFTIDSVDKSYSKTTNFSGNNKIESIYQNISENKNISVKGTEVNKKAVDSIDKNLSVNKISSIDTNTGKREHYFDKEETLKSCNMAENNQKIISEKDIINKGSSGNDDIVKLYLENDKKYSNIILKTKKTFGSFRKANEYYNIAKIDEQNFFEDRTNQILDLKSLQVYQNTLMEPQSNKIVLKPIVLPKRNLICSNVLVIPDRIYGTKIEDVREFIHPHKANKILLENHDGFPYIKLYTKSLSSYYSLLYSRVSESDTFLSSTMFRFSKFYPHFANPLFRNFNFWVDRSKMVFTTRAFEAETAVKTVKADLNRLLCDKIITKGAENPNNESYFTIKSVNSFGTQNYSVIVELNENLVSPEKVMFSNGLENVLCEIQPLSFFLDSTVMGVPSINDFVISGLPNDANFVSYLKNIFKDVCHNYIARLKNGNYLISLSSAEDVNKAISKNYSLHQINGNNFVIKFNQLQFPQFNVTSISSKTFYLKISGKTEINVDEILHWLTPILPEKIGKDKNGLLKLSFKDCDVATAFLYKSGSIYGKTNLPLYARYCPQSEENAFEEVLYERFFNYNDSFLYDVNLQLEQNINLSVENDINNLVKNVTDESSEKAADKSIDKVICELSEKFTGKDVERDVSEVKKAQLVDVDVNQESKQNVDTKKIVKNDVEVKDRYLLWPLHPSKPDSYPKRKLSYNQKKKSIVFNNKKEERGSIKPASPSNNTKISEKGQNNVSGSSNLLPKRFKVVPPVKFFKENTIANRIMTDKKISALKHVPLAGKSIHNRKPVGNPTLSRRFMPNKKYSGLTKIISGSKNPSKLASSDRSSQLNRTRITNSHFSRKPNISTAEKVRNSKVANGITAISSNRIFRKQFKNGKSYTLQNRYNQVANKEILDKNVLSNKTLTKPSTGKKVKKVGGLSGDNTSEKRIKKSFSRRTNLSAMPRMSSNKKNSEAFNKNVLIFEGNDVKYSTAFPSKTRALKKHVFDHEKIVHRQGENSFGVFSDSSYKAAKSIQNHYSRVNDRLPGHMKMNIVWNVKKKPN